MPSSKCFGVRNFGNRSMLAVHALVYLERRPDPSDGRAKLISPSTRGRELLFEAGNAVARLEQRWRHLCDNGTFDDACHTLDQLLGALDHIENPD